MWLPPSWQPPPSAGICTRIFFATHATPTPFLCSFVGWDVLRLPRFTDGQVMIPVQAGYATPHMRLFWVSAIALCLPFEPPQPLLICFIVPYPSTTPFLPAAYRVGLFAFVVPVHHYPLPAYPFRTYPPHPGSTVGHILVAPARLPTVSPLPYFLRGIAYTGSLVGSLLHPSSPGVTRLYGWVLLPVYLPFGPHSGVRFRTYAGLVDCPRTPYWRRARGSIPVRVVWTHCHRRRPRHHAHAHPPDIVGLPV